MNEIQIAIVYHSETGNTRQMAELVRQGCLRVAGVKARCMPVDDVDGDYVAASNAAILGSPTYEGSCTWQMKRYLDTAAGALADKLGAVFASQNWPGGGGADFAEMTIIAAALVLGMVVYSGGISQGYPPLHFGAVSQKAPTSDIDRERAKKLGENIATMAKKLFEHI